MVAATNIPLSHAAILDAERGEVVEAVGDGVRAVPLRDFLHICHRVLLIRPRWWSEVAGQQAVANARDKIGEEYDFLGTVGLGTSERFYCTELCAWAYHPFFKSTDEDLPHVLEPGQMYLWGAMVWDSLPRR